MFSIYLKYIALFLVIISSTCASKVFKVSNSEELQKALEDASPGDNISLSGNTTFEGIFHAVKNGTRDSPITLLTEDSDKDKTFNAKLIGVGGGTTGEAALTITGNYYDLRNISIGHNNSLALLIEGTDTSLYGVGIKNADKAVKIEGARVYIKDCYISEVGSGIQMDGDFGIIRDTFVTGQGIVSITAEKKTCCGTLMGNVFDGKVDIKGTDFNLFDNLIEGKSQL